ncbi:MAG: GNAT family N-acetyltransferase [Clostridia bacterium]
MIIETKRLFLRQLKKSDFDGLCKILQDTDVMYAYEGPFSDKEVQDWLYKQLMRYKTDGFGLNAVILKETGEMIGQCGLTMQDFKDQKLLEIGYLFQKKYWHNGYATEAAIACKEYAFTTLGAKKVCSIIRDTNKSSQNVALRNGMTPKDTFTKYYRGVEMPHILFSIERKSLNFER